jgi:hypothetical protein
MRRPLNYAADVPVLHGGDYLRVDVAEAAGLIRLGFGLHYLVRDNSRCMHGADIYSA